MLLDRRLCLRHDTAYTMKTVKTRSTIFIVICSWFARPLLVSNSSSNFDILIGWFTPSLCSSNVRTTAAFSVSVSVVDVQLASSHHETFHCCIMHPVLAIAFRKRPVKCCSLPLRKCCTTYKYRLLNDCCRRLIRIRD